MAYRHGAAAPLILYPALGAALVNPGFESAMGSEWTLTGAATRVLGDAAEGSYSLKINPAGAAAHAAQKPPRTNYRLAPDAFYANFWAKAKAGAGQFDCKVRLMDPDGTDVVAPTFLALTVGAAAGIPIDNLYRHFRSGPIAPGAFDPTSPTAVLQITVGALLTTPTYDVYVDAVHLGHALDFMDLGPMADGCQWSAKLPEGARTAGVIERIGNGYAAVANWAEYRRGKNDIFPMSDAGVDLYSQFFNYVRHDGETLTAFQLRNDFREQYLERAMLMNTAKNIRRHRDLWRASLDIQTVPLP